MDFLEDYKTAMKIHEIHTHICLKNTQILDLSKRKKDKESTYCKNVLNSEASKFSTVTCP